MDNSQKHSNFKKGNNTMNITLSDQLITRIIFTLKQLDVNGYDSMDKLVGVVSLLEKIMEKAAQQEKEETAEE